MSESINQPGISQEGISTGNGEHKSVIGETGSKTQAIFLNDHSTLDTLRTGSYNDLKNHFCTGKAFSEQEVEALLANPIIKKAYLQGDTITLIIEDGGTWATPWITIGYAKEESSQDELYKTQMKVGNHFYYPRNILGFKRTGDTSFEAVSRRGVFSSSMHLPPSQLDELLEQAKGYGAVELPSIYYGTDAEKLLVERGIRKILKNQE